MMVLNKSETIKELEAAYVKFAKQSKEFYALESELRSKIQNASSSEEAALLREESDRTYLKRKALSKEIRDILDQLLYLKYCSPNLKYFDLPLDEKVIDEHFDKFFPSTGSYPDIWDDLFSYDYHMDKLIKSGVKQPNLFYYSDAYHPHYVEGLLYLIKKVVKFRFVNGICNTLFHRNSYDFILYPHPSVSDDYFFYPFYRKESFYREYSLPLYHLLPKRVATELHNLYNNPCIYDRFRHSIPEPIRKYRMDLIYSNTSVDYYAYRLSDCRVFPYIVNLSAKYFAYNIARFLVKNVLFLPKKLSLYTSTFVLDFPDALNIKDVSKAVLSRTVHYLDDILEYCFSKDCSKENTDENYYSFSFASGRSFKFRLVLSHSESRLNYPYRSFYVPGCQESDEEFANKISIHDKFSYLRDTRVSDIPLFAFDEFVEPIDLIIENNLTKEGEPGYMESDTNYILNMFVSDIDYNNLKVNEPFSFERFEQQLEELKKKAVYGGTFSRNHYSFLIANTAFYQFEKYLEYELEQHKIRNNINYEQMLEERKEKEKED